MRICDLIVEAKIPAKCQKCGYEFEFTIKDDVFLCITDWNMYIACPKCGAKHRIDLEMELAEDKDETAR